MAKKRSNVSLIKTFTSYGVHIWAILIIANAALAYAFNFATQAAVNPTNPELENTIAQINDAEIPEEPKDEEDTGSALPKGPTIDLIFTVPGIGSGGGTMTPKRLKRNVIVYLYSLDENILNRNVKPLYTVKTTANFDNNPLSPTYTSFKNPLIDLGADVKEGNYQIAFRTDESLRTIVKESPEQIGGRSIALGVNAPPVEIHNESVLMGDTIPKEGDNLVDISDYNAFINCFGERNSSDFCSQSNYGDFDDNGTIDGVDYNVLLISFRALLNQGQSIPKITVAPTGPARVSRLSNLATPTPKQKTKATATPTQAAEEQASSGGGGSIVGGILFFFFLIIIGATGFILYKKNEKVRTMINSIIHLSPTGVPSAPPADPNAPPADPNAPVDPNAPPPADPNAPAPADTAQTPPAPEATAAPADPNAIAASTEIPVGQAAAPTDPAAAPAPAPAAPAADSGEAKSYYVKKKLPDDAKTGFWLVLTDDNGAHDAHYTTTDVSDGFAKVKGTMKTENGKTFLEVTELTPEG